MEAAALVILCGGRARRMGGRPKGLLAFPDGTSVVQRTVDRAGPLCAERWLSATAQTAPAMAAACGLPVCLDEGRGPAHALAMAARAVASPWILAVGADQPALDARALGALLAARDGGADAVAFVVEGRRWPLPALYRARALAALPAASTVDASLRSVLDALGAREVPWDDAASLTSVNTPEEAERAGLVLAPR